MTSGKQDKKENLAINAAAAGGLLAGGLMGHFGDRSSPVAALQTAVRIASSAESVVSGVCSTIEAGRREVRRDLPPVPDPIDRGSDVDRVMDLV